MTSTTASKSDIASIHGIRFLNLMMLIISHKTGLMGYEPISNRTEMISFFQGSISVVFRACYLNTEVFLMLSGLLVSYSFVGRFERGQKIDVAKEITGRYLRFTPPMTALIIFITFILPLLGNGPQWPMMITHQSNLCKYNWWKNLLMIHTWFGFENICSPNTHHVGTDFELFVVSIFLIIFIKRYTKTGVIVATVLVVATIALKVRVVYVEQLVIYITFGTE